MSRKFNPTSRYAQTTSYTMNFLRRKKAHKSINEIEKGCIKLGSLPETIHTGIAVLWRQKLMCDVELVTFDGKHIHAHKLILATCCDYFYDMFAEEPMSTDCTTQLEMEDLPGSVLETIVEAMYTGKLKIEETTVEYLLSSAYTLGMFVIVNACEDFMLEHICCENCLQYLGTAFKYNLTRLSDSSFEIAAKNFQNISRRPLFRNLPVEHLIPILKRNDLEINSELEVFHCMRTWVEEHKQSRLQHVADVMATVRLPLLTPAEIVDSVESSSIIRDIPECQKLVKEALHYHLMPTRQCVLQSSRTVPRKKAETFLVIVGGVQKLTNDRICDEVMMFNHVSNAWEHVTKLPEPRHHHAVAVLNGFLYVAGGAQISKETDATVAHVYRYNPRECKWLQVASMSTCRQKFQIGVLKGALYAVGGRVTEDKALSSVERYSPALDTWEEVARLSSPRECVAVGSMGGRLYAVGGSGNKEISRRFERYSPTENKWETLKDVNTPRFFGHLLNVKKCLYLVGGATIDKQGQVICVDTVEKYSKSANQWTVVTKMKTPRSESACTIIKDKVYILGGYDWKARECLSDVECFDTETHRWTVIPQINQPLIGMAAAGIVLYGHNSDHRLGANSDNVHELSN